MPLDLKPALERVTVTTSDGILSFFKRHGFDLETLSQSVARSVREPIRKPDDASGERWIMFLPVRGLVESSYYCEFKWNRARDVFELVAIHGYLKSRDQDLSRHYNLHARVRASGPPFTISGSPLFYAARANLTLGEVAQALHNPLGPPLPVLDEPGTVWQVGLTKTQREVVIEYAQHDGIPHVTKVQLATREMRQKFVTMSGKDFEAKEVRRVRLSRGPLRFRIIDFAPGVQTKILRLHQVSRDEVVEALELSSGLVPSDEVRYALEESRFISLARLRSGRPLKVALFRGSEVDLTILSAYEPDPKLLLLYKRTLMGQTRTY